MWFTKGVPQGQLSQFVPDNILGLHGSFGSRRSAGSPVLLGTEVGIELYASDQTTEYVDAEGVQTTADVIVYENMATWHLFARIQPPDGIFRPYFESFLGAKLFFSTRTTSSDDTNGRGGSETVISFSNIGASYGLGAGIALSVFNALVGDENGKFSFILGARYLLGAEVNYLIPPTENIHENDRVNPDTQSKSGVLETRIGFSVGI